MLEEAVANVRDFYQRIFWQWPDAITEYGEGYVLNYSGVGWLSGANQLWVDDPQAVTPALLEKCLRFFRPHKAEWSVVVIPEFHPGLREQCLRWGGYVRWESPVMWLDGLPAIEQDVSWVQVQHVREGKAADFARRIVAEAFHMEMDVNDRLIRPEHAEDNTIHHFLAYYQGHPAAAASLTLSGHPDSGIAGIWNVGTRRIFRKRGLASALMAAMCRQAAALGYNQSVLLASSMGQPLYTRMGYREIGTVSYLGLSAY